MKLKSCTFYFTFICSFISTSLIFGQQSENEDAFIPNNMIDCIQYLKKTLHPKTLNKFAALQKQDYFSSPYFISLEEYISSKWLSNKQGNLVLFMNNNNKSSNHAKTIVRAFIESLGNTTFSQSSFFQNQRIYPEALPLSEEEYQAMLKRANLYLQGYDLTETEWPYKSQMSMIEKNGKFGLVSFDLNILVEPFLDEIENEFNNEGDYSFLRVKMNNKLGLVNVDGKLILPIEFDCLNFMNGSFIAKRDSVWYKYKFESKDELSTVRFNEDIVDHQYMNDEEGFICTCFAGEDLNVGYSSEKEKKAFVSYNTGKELFEVSYDLSFSGFEKLSSGLPRVFSGFRIAVLRRNGKKGIIGFVDKKILIPFEYDDIGELGGDKGEDYIQVKKNGKWGIISHSNELLLPYHYDQISNVCESDLEKQLIISCSQNGKWGFIDFSGNIIIPFTHEKTSFLYTDKLNKKYYICQKDGKYGAVDSKNNVILPFEFASTYQMIEKLD